ncbi:MAG: O-phospho-L-seryl-tRNA:Cys-tRNA synthase [Candidatus Hodarchaeota archaeon]
MGLNDDMIVNFSMQDRENQENYINLQPIQRGGVLPPESKKILLSYGDGYSLCDFCFSGRLDEIEKPSVSSFLQEFAKFIDMDVAMPTGACREAKRVILQQLTSKTPVGKEPVLIIDGLAHYSTFLAAENAGVSLMEVPHSGHPTFKLEVEKYGELIDSVLDDSKKHLVAAFLTHVDYLYGNLTPPSEVGKICRKKGVPFIVNGAYTVGILPFSGKKCNADFVTASGHKSMASSGPIGILACSDEYKDLMFPTSTIKGPWSGRSFGRKIKTLLGCPSVYGAPLATLMSSFPHVVERTRPENWKKELENARRLSSTLECIEGVNMLGIKPHEHTLMQFETPAFQEVAKFAPKKGYFLHNELKSRGIVGIFAGMVKSMKLNTFGLTSEQVDHVGNSFLEIAKKYNINVQ